MKAPHFISILWLVLGAGCSREQTETERSQFEETKRKAEAGDAGIQYYVGLSYESGAYGLKKDNDEAVKWYRRAAEQGNPDGEYKLARAYYNGNGLAQDCAEGVKWYHKAAYHGNASAQRILGVCYWNGEYVTKNYVEAHKWLGLAAAQNAEGTTKILQNLEKVMTREQIAEATRLAGEFRARPAR